MKMEYTRIWEGYKEYQDQPYVVGQRLIQHGRLEGCFESVTAEYDEEEKALQALDCLGCQGREE